MDPFAFVISEPCAGIKNTAKSLIKYNYRNITYKSQLEDNTLEID